MNTSNKDNNAFFHITLNRIGKLFLKEPNRQYFRLCGPSTLPDEARKQPQKTDGTWMNEHACSVPIKLY